MNPYGRSDDTQRRVRLTHEQSEKVNALVLREYRRTFHWYRKLTDFDKLYILDWTIATTEGREAYKDAVETVEGTPKSQQL